MPRALSVLILLAAASSASGQTVPVTSQPIEDVRRNARMHVGPFYITPALQLKELGVDTNVFNEPGEQKSDFMFNVSPKVAVWVPVARRALLTATLATDLVWYSKYDSERSIDPQVGVRGEVYLRRLTVFAENTYLNTRQRTNFEIDVRTRQLHNTVTAGIGYRVSPKFSMEVAGRRGVVEFDGDAVFLGTPLQQTLNRTTTAAGVTMRHRATPLTTFVLKAEASRDEFEFSPERSSDSVRVMPGVTLNPRALIHGTAYVGFRRFAPTDKVALPAFTGLVADLSASYTLLGATTFGVSYTRDVQYSFERLQPYFVMNSVGGSVRQAIGPKFDVLASVDRCVYSYRNLMLPTAAPGIAGVDPRSDVTWMHSASLGYRLGRQGRIGAGFSHQQRESDTRRFRDYRTTRFVATVSYVM